MFEPSATTSQGLVDQGTVDQAMTLEMTEVELQQELYHSKLLLESLPGIAFTCEADAQLSMRYLSQGCFSVTGYHPDELLQLPLGYNSIIHREDLDRVVKKIQTAAQQDQSYEIDYRIICCCGQEKWVHEQGNFILDAVERIPRVQGFISDISRIKATENELLVQKKLLHAVASATVNFVSCSDLEIAIHQALAIVGQAADVDRIYIYQNHPHLQTGEIAMSMRYEWTRTGIAPSIHQAHWQNLRYSEYGLEHWHECLASGKPFKAITCDLTPSEQMLLSRDQIVSIILVPILIDQSLWGYIGFDDCYRERQWSFDEDSILLTMAASIGSAIQNQQARKALLEAESRYQRLFDNAVEGIFQSTYSGQYLSVNPALARIYGYDSPTEMLSCLTDIKTQLYVDQEQFLKFREDAKNNKVVKNHESRVYRKDGSIIWISESARSVLNEFGDLDYYEGFVEDITEYKLAEIAQKNAEQQLRYSASHDALTGLLNRATFIDQLRQEIDQRKQNKNYSFALLFLDLDRFKLINDTLGHDAGDQLLIETANRLQQCMRVSDLVARWGGDEFTILLRNIQCEEDIFSIIERLQMSLANPFQIAGRRNIIISASIGIAHDESDYKSPQDLLRDADMAMYSAKVNGRAGHTVFQPRMRENAIKKLNLELDLYRAVEQEELLLYYQPIISLASGKIIGFEALLRWHHGDKGILKPNDFLQIAEETGLIISLDLWVLKKACNQLRCWQKRFNLPKSFGLNINISGRSINQSDFLYNLGEILDSTKIDSNCLHLEITETALIEEYSDINHTIQGLKDKGIWLHIDDFGSGYSSFNYLRQFSFDYMKIDRSFVMYLAVNRESVEITRAITQLAHALRMRIIAEGVETKQQLDLLKSLGCEFAQGYLFSHPLAIQEVEVFLHSSLVLDFF